MKAVAAKKRIILSIGMIMKNNADHLEECLKALKPFRSAVPTEIVIVDTGSTDNSVAIAKRYADKVLFFEWVDDFSAARNYGLEHCTGDWFMFVDTDEIFTETEDLVTFFRTDGMNRMYNSATYIQRNLSGTYGFDGTFKITGSSDHKPQRIRRNDGWRFKGAIHEYFDFAPTMYYSRSVVKHYGYLVSEEAKLAENKSDRNSKILWREYDSEPEKLRTVRHLLDCDLGERWEVLNDICDRFLSDDPKWSEYDFSLAKKYGYARNVVFGVIRGYYVRVLPEKVVDTYEKIYVAKCGEDNEFKCDMLYYVSVSKIILGDYEGAADSFEEMVQLRGRVVKGEFAERPELYALDSMLADNQTYWSLAVLYTSLLIELKRYERAFELFVNDCAMCGFSAAQIDTRRKRASEILKKYKTDGLPATDAYAEILEEALPRERIGKFFEFLKKSEYSLNMNTAVFMIIESLE